MTPNQEFIDKTIQKHGNFVIPILQDIQEQYNYLPEESMIMVAEKLNMHLIDLYGVATFYKAFSLTPKGEHIITVCLGTACYIRGGAKILETISKELDIEPGETTDDMSFTLETVNCLGCCAIGPIVVIDNQYFGEMTPQKTINLLKKFKEGRKCSPSHPLINLKTTVER
ncbi:MAG: NADH-quinone oxidoreductase subunit NuoE [Candidatus Lokiarchaeota archaeon]|nr:NADH-quinone oxidoreductase subunit NuoE [Candidatus Lokiarchaeota archaeon]